MTAWRNYYRNNGNKYGNRKVEADGIVFDSIKEKRRFGRAALLLGRQ